MKDIFPIFDKIKSKEDQEKLLGQKGIVLWMYGHSGTGKSTIANALQEKLYSLGKYNVILDGDNIRDGLNKGLGFTTEDRTENIRRVSEVAKLFCDNGAIVLASFVCPKNEMRANAREVIGEDFNEVYIKTSLETLMARDTKGFYKKAQEGKMKNFTGVNQGFDEPANPEIIIDTDELDIHSCVNRLYDFIQDKICL